MRLAASVVLLTTTLTGIAPVPPTPPPVQFLNRDVRANLKTEGPSTLGGTLGFVLLVILAVMVAYSLLVGPYWYAIVALVLFIATVGLLFKKSTQD